MLKILPINDHVLIKPLSKNTTYATSQQTYEERGEVLEMDKEISLQVGDIVYFDSWCAARYEDGEGNEHWLIPFDKIRAIEKHEPQVSE